MLRINSSSKGLEISLSNNHTKSGIWTGKRWAAESFTVEIRYCSVAKGARSSIPTEKWRHRCH